MNDAVRTAMRVALLVEECDRGEFRILLENEGMEVVLDEDFELPLPETLNGAEVLLVGIGDQPDRARVQGVLQQSPVPVLLNQGGIGNSDVWHRRLMGKLKTLANWSVPNASVSTQPNRPDLRVVQSRKGADVQPPLLVVLGASIGGPKGVTRFLQALPDDLPVTFLLAQHISEAFQDLLVEQLDRCSGWSVALPGAEQAVGAGQVWLVPADNRITLDAQGAIRRCRQSWDSAHHPDIDEVLESAARAFGARCGAVMFSGLGKDGIQGCGVIVAHGGFVWAQSSESCVISNMPENTRRSCEVELSGTPEDLAQALVARCQMQSVSIN